MKFNSKKANILFISSLLQGSGNYTTSNRLANYLKDTFIHQDSIITLYDCETNINDNNNKEILDKYLLECDIVILLHAFRSGKLLPNDFSKPIFLILGGTDINNDLKDNFKLEIIKNTINKSCIIYSFNKLMVDILNNQVNNGIINIKEDTAVILMPQAVILPESNPNNIYSLKKEYNIPIDSKLILLPAGIRKVKDPLFLINEIYQWHQHDSQIYFAIIGPIIDHTYFDEMIQLINSFGNLESSGIIYCHKIEHCQLIDAMKESNLIINSSLVSKYLIFIMLFYTICIIYYYYYYY
jgi:hypothetical protein